MFFTSKFFINPDGLIKKTKKTHQNLKNKLTPYNHNDNYSKFTYTILSFMELINTVCYR